VEDRSARGWSKLRGVLALNDDQFGGANQNIA
jgi:hypothetical protein